MNAQKRWRQSLILLLAGTTLAIVAGCRDRSSAETTSSAPAATHPASYPKRAPDFTLADLNGQPVRLSDFRGKGIILNFWATWCPSCVREIPHLVEIYETNRDKGIVVLGLVVNDSQENVQRFVQEHSVSYPVLMGSNAEILEVARAFGGVQYVPTTFLIRPDGTIAQRLIGYHDKATFESLLPELFPAPETPAAPGATAPAE